MHLTGGTLNSGSKFPSIRASGGPVRYDVVVVVMGLTFVVVVTVKAYSESDVTVAPSVRVALAKVAQIAATTVNFANAFSRLFVVKYIFFLNKTNKF